MIFGSISFHVNIIIIENRRWDPITGILSATTTTGSSMLHSTADMIYNPYKEFQRGRSPKPSSRALEATIAPTGAHPQEPSSREQSVTDNEILHESAPPSLQPDLPQRKPGILVAGSMLGATVKGFGKFTGSYFKGVVVDIPHAAAEGFRQVPRLYGEQPKDYGSIQDWKSGAIFAGKNFVDGMSDAFTGIITQPVNGAKEEGALGAVKGFAKGTIGFATKIPSGKFFQSLSIWIFEWSS